MLEPRWPDDIPPPHAALYSLGQRCLDEVNGVAHRHPPTTIRQHEMLEIARSQALAIDTIAKQLLRLRHEIDDSSDEASAFGVFAAMRSAPAAIRRQISTARSKLVRLINRLVWVWQFRAGHAAAAATEDGRVRKLRRQWLMIRLRRRVPSNSKVGDEFSASCAISDEDVLALAGALIVRHRNASTSWVQRNLRITYNQAAALMQIFENAGIVSAPDPIGRRVVLV